MAASDWTLYKSNASDPTIESSGGNHFIRCHANAANGREAMMYNGSQSKDTELIFLLKKGGSYIGFPGAILRSAAKDVANCYFLFFDDAGLAHIAKLQGGTLFTIYNSGFINSFAAFQKVRIRVWDLAFPVGAVKFSLDLWSIDHWVEQFTFIENSGVYYGVTGWRGFGLFGAISAEGVADFDDVTVAHRGA
jgi:hypothetical protein